MYIINHPKLIIYFGSNTATIGEEYIVKESISVNEQLMNDLKSSSNRISLNITKDCPSIDVILSTAEVIRAVLYDDVDIVFTGYLSNQFNWGITSTGLKTFAITIEDQTRVLQKKYSENDVIINSTVSEVISNICNICGIAPNPANPTIEEIAVAEVAGGTKCVDILDEILYEAGYVYRFNQTGLLTLFDNAVTTETSRRVGRDNLYVKGKDAVSISKSLIQYDQAYVNYTSLKKKNNVLIYEDISGQDSNNPHCHIVLPPHTAYPSQLPVTSAPEELDSFYEVADIQEGKDVLYFDNLNTRDGFKFYGGTSTCDITAVNHKRLNIVVKNSSSVDSHITQLSARGDLCVINSEDRVIAPVSGNSPITVEMKYLHSKAAASRLANILCDYYSKCNFSYTFYSKEEFNIGDVVEFDEDVYSGINTLVLINQKSYSKGLYAYTAFSVSDFNIERPVKFTQTQTQASNTQPVIGSSIQVQYARGNDPYEAPTDDMTWGDEDIFFGSSDGTWDAGSFDYTLSGEGKYVWMRSRVGESGEWTYTRMTGIEALDYTLQVIPDVYSINSRGVVEAEQTISIIANPNTSINNPNSFHPVWTFNGSITGVTLTQNGWSCTITIPVGCRYTQIPIKCSISGLNDKEITVTGVKVGVPQAKYYGALESDPIYNSVFPFIIGDYYLKQTLVDGEITNAVPYRYNGINWYEVTSSSPDYAPIMSTVLADAVKGGVTSTSSIYGFFQNLAAQDGVIKNLFSQNIEVGNCIRSSNYDNTGANTSGLDGFYLGSDGILKATGANIEGTITATSGSLDSVTTSRITSSNFEYGDTNMMTWGLTWSFGFGTSMLIRELIALGGATGVNIPYRGTITLANRLVAVDSPNTYYRIADDCRSIFVHGTNFDATIYVNVNSVNTLSNSSDGVVSKDDQGSGLGEQYYINKVHLVPLIEFAQEYYGGINNGEAQIIITRNYSFPRVKGILPWDSVHSYTEPVSIGNHEYPFDYGHFRQLYCDNLIINPLSFNNGELSTDIGSTQLPNGLIIKWKKNPTSTIGSNYEWKFVDAFPTACIVAFPITLGGHSDNAYVKSFDRTKAVFNGTSSYSYVYIALGF